MPTHATLKVGGIMHLWQRTSGNTSRFVIIDLVAEAEEAAREAMLEHRFKRLEETQSWVRGEIDDLIKIIEGSGT